MTKIHKLKTENVDTPDLWGDILELSDYARILDGLTEGICRLDLSKEEQGRNADCVMRMATLIREKADQLRHKCA